MREEREGQVIPCEEGRTCFSFGTAQPHTKTQAHATRNTQNTTHIPAGVRPEALSEEVADAFVDGGGEALALLEGGVVVPAGDAPDLVGD